MDIIQTSESGKIQPWMNFLQFKQTANLCLAFTFIKYSNRTKILRNDVQELLVVIKEPSTKITTRMVKIVSKGHRTINSNVVREICYFFL